MPVEITGAYPPEHRLKPGDVVIVSRRLFDKQTKQPFTWRHFGVVTSNIGTRAIRYIVLDEKRRERDSIVWFGEDFNEDGADIHVWYLPEDEWPDGVHAFRTRFILEGRLDEVI